MGYTFLPRDLMSKPGKYKSELCSNFTKLGQCPYGSRCQFAHGKGDLRRTETQYLTNNYIPFIPPPKKYKKLDPKISFTSRILDPILGSKFLGDDGNVPEHISKFFPPDNGHTSNIWVPNFS